MQIQTPTRGMRWFLIVAALLLTALLPAIFLTTTAHAADRNARELSQITLPGRGPGSSAGGKGSGAEESDPNDSDAEEGSETEDGSADTPPDSTSPAGSGSGEAQQEPAPVSDLEGVQSAVVQIEAVGTFMDPSAGLVTNSAGRGSGFIIHPSGIAVTNHHVVTGGAIYQIYVDGYEEPLNARVLGVSECADIAVIDIQGGGYPYLEWYEGDIKVGLDVYAAGFPLGDPEYTLTRGIVSKANAGGESSWASVEAVLQHDAIINPGNSGGPLIDANGAVVGVNYRKNDADQYFAIARDEVLGLIDELRAGNDIDSIGINGAAISDGESLSGVWVSSVDSGSVADQVGLRPGDIIMTMEGLPLAEDGTLATYCGILRSHSADDVLTLEVLRLETDELLEGQLNGRVLAPSFSFSQELEPSETDSSAPGNDSTEATPAYTDYMTITDEQGILSAEVPVEWADVQEAPWENDEEVFGIKLYASPDLESFSSSWGIPGVVMSYSELFAGQVSAEEMLDALDYSESCEFGGRTPLPDGFFIGAFDTWENCGEAGSTALVLGLVPETEAYITRMEVYASSDADLEAIDRILDSFVVASPQDERKSETNFGSSESVPESSSGDAAYEFVVVTDAAISALFPDAWSDTESEAWIIDDEEIGSIFSASSDLESFNDTWETAGIVVYTADDIESDFDPIAALDSSDFSEFCAYDDRVEHEHAIFGVGYSGAYDIWTDCDDGDNVYVSLSAVSDPVDHAVFVYFLGLSEADLEAFGEFLDTFYVYTEATAPIVDAALAETTATPEQYVTLVDEDGVISINVPATWDDVDNDDWIIDDEVVGRQILAAPDIEAFNEEWNTPGVFVGVSESIAAAFTPEEIVDILDFNDDCTYDDRYDYESDFFIGVYDIYSTCGGEEGEVFVVYAANPVDDESLMAVMWANLITKQDADAFEQILDTLAVARSGTIAQSRAIESIPTATVVARALNVRNGPGTNYGKVAQVASGDLLDVAGQAQECAWLLIFTPDGQPGWVSGNPQYVTLQADCEEIPEADVPDAPPASSSGASGASSTPSGQGCFNFVNNLGAELNITFTHRDTKVGRTFKVPADQSSRQCFDPGAYTYTLDAPPPWGSTNGELTVNAGDNFNFPVGASE